MAKQSNISGKVRFVMLEAEIVDGNLSEIAQAIAGAIAPAPVVQRVIQQAPVLAEPNGKPSKQTEPANLFTEVDGQEENQPLPVSKVSRPSKPKKYPVPEVVEMDLNSGDVPWEEFAKKKNPTEVTRKFLVAAAWLKEHRGLDSITADHVYTCFRKVGWSTNIEDFGAPFRGLKKQKWVGSSQPGTFEINHLGLDQVEKMGGGD